MTVWNFFVNLISYALEITRTESSILVVFILMGGIIKGLYPWKKEWKSEKTKDKDGNEVTIYSHLNN